MVSQNIFLSNWNYGVIMIGVFALVIVILALVPILLMKNDKKKIKKH